MDINWKSHQICYHYIQLKALNYFELQQTLK